MKKSLFTSVDHPYYISAPDYRYSSAGIRALHYFCHALNELGQEAYIICNIFNPMLRTPKLTEIVVRKHKAEGRIPIVLYPEVIIGNPLNLPVVARWILNKPGHLGGDLNYSDNEILFHYQRGLLLEGTEASPLYLPTIDRAIFNNFNNPLDSSRKGICYYANKYLLSGNELTHHVKNAISLCHDVKLSPKEIAKVLRESEFLYCYEPSAIINEALLCGCPVFIVPTKYSSTFSEGFFGYSGGGVAMDYSEEAFAFAREDVGRLATNYDGSIKRCWAQIEQYIHLTQQAMLQAIAKDSLLLTSLWEESVVEVITTTSNNVLIKNNEKILVDSYTEWQEKRAFLNKKIDFWKKLTMEFKPIPEFHFLIVLNQNEELLLANTIDSLSEQIYLNWHLTVVSEEESPNSIFYECELLTWVSLDCIDDLYERINGCIGERDCDWFCFLEPGAVFDARCLTLLSYYININKNWSYIYIDEDQIDNKGVRSIPLFKPDFNLDLLRSTAYIGTFCFIKTDILSKIGGFSGFSGAENYDLAFRVLEASGEQSIGHVPDVLAHRPIYSVREFDSNMGLHVLSMHLQRNNIDAFAELSSVKGCFNVIYKVDLSARISIIIPTKDQQKLLKACIDSILDKTSYLNYEIIIIDNQSIESETIEYVAELAISHPDKIKIIKYDNPYNFSAINNIAVEEASGEYMVLLNNDTIVLQEEWLQGMLSQVQREEVGVVGVKLVLPDKTVQHAGIILGMGGVAGYPHAGIPMGSPGYMNRAAISQCVSAVSAACMMVSKELYQQIGGLDANTLGVLFGDIDFCLKVQQLGKKVVWTPYVTLIHHGAESLRDVKKNKLWEDQAKKEVELMLDRWMPELSHDPAYNQHLSLKSSDFQVDTSINLTWNEGIKSKPKVYAFPLDSSGVGYYRVRGPLAALTSNGVIESSLADNWDTLIFPKPIEMERINPDVLLIQNAFLDHMLTPWKQYKRFNNAFMVAGLDDLVYMLPSGHPKQGVWPVNVRRKVKELFRSSDRVIVANEALEAEFSSMADDIIVVPNYLENWRWDSLKGPEKIERKRLRIGWAGGTEHVSDLRFILPIVESLSKEVDWIFMGLCIDELKPFVKEIYAGVNFESYPQQLANLNLDLAIAPLMHNKFNECKTNLRLLEYGIMGWPVVCTDILPYKNAPVTRVANNVNEWVRVIREKINEPKALEKEGAVLRQWVVDNYMLDDHLEQWGAALLPS